MLIFPKYMVMSFEESGMTKVLFNIYKDVTKY